MVRLALVLAVGSRMTAAGSDVRGPTPVPDLAAFFAKYCLDCHDDETRRGDLSLEEFDDLGALNGPRLELWRLIREQLEFGDMPPTKSEQPTPEERRAAVDSMRLRLLETQEPGAISDDKLDLPQFGNYVDHSALFGARRPRVDPAPARLWRLRPAIYTSAMAKFADRIGPLANGLNTTDGSEFKDYAAAYFLDEAATATLLANAKTIASAMIGPRSKLRVFARLAKSTGEVERERVDSAVESGFRTIVGRAPSSEELKRYREFFGRAMEIADGETATKALLAAILVQPEVLFRTELGDGRVDAHGRVRLAPVEIAYALSYALGNQPLTEFLRAATSGRLATADGVAEHVRTRLLDESPLHDKNPRVLQFFREYFNYPFANEVFKDKPEGGVHEPALLVGDLELTIREILKRDRRVLAELLTTREYYVNARLKRNKESKSYSLERAHDRKWPYHATFGLPLDWKWAAERQPVKFPRDERAGVLTHPAWLAAWSGNFDNHPVQRGKWIRTRLLGGTVPDVPIGVDARIQESEHETLRDRLERTTNKPECWRCHRKMDSLGVAFERYDHYGRHRRLDANQPVDASGAVSRTGVTDLDSKFEGPTELLRHLAGSKHVEQVFVRHVFRFYMGRNETLGDANTLQDAHAAYREGEGSFRELVVSLLSSDSFLFRSVREFPTEQTPETRGRR